MYFNNNKRKQSNCEWKLKLLKTEIFNFWWRIQHHKKISRSDRQNRVVQVDIRKNPQKIPKFMQLNLLNINISINRGKGLWFLRMYFSQYTTSPKVHPVLGNPVRFSITNYQNCNNMENNQESEPKTRFRRSRPASLVT